jgi:hypothetical protein
MEKNIAKTEQILQELAQIKDAIKIPVLCFLSAADWIKRDRLWQYGVRDIIQLPISKDEMALQMERFIEDISDMVFDQEEAGMYGKLEDYNLLDLIQTLENNKKTGILTLYRSRDEGKIWFQEGNIHDARYRSFEPLPALLKMVAWMDGDFSITFVEENYEKVIEYDNHQILIEAIQYIDTRNKILNAIPDVNEILLISVDADMEQMDEEQVIFLRFFHGGNTILAFLDDFDRDDVFLLEIIHEFIDKNLLVTRNEFDRRVKEQEFLAEQAGIKKVFKRIFSKKEEQAEPAAASTDWPAGSDDNEEFLHEQGIVKFPHLFFRDDPDLDGFKKRIEQI